MEDDPFDIVPLQPPEPAPVPGEIARGPGWIVTQEGDAFRLDHLTGELVDRSETIEITRIEAEQLKAGQRDIDDIVRTHRNVASLIDGRL